MTLKLAQFCDDPKKIPTKSSYPQKIFIFLKTPKNIEIQNFEPKKMGRAYVCVKISEYPPWGGRFPRLLDKALTRQKLVEKIKILLTYELNERSKKENNLYKMIIIYK